MLARVIDFETTGMPPEAAICEIGWCDVVDGEVLQSSNLGLLVNPQREIQIEAMAIHHIRAADVAQARPVDAGLRLLMEPRPDVFVAHNCAFERQFFEGGGVPWICTMKVARRLWPDCPSHSNQVLRYFHSLDLDEVLAMPPHRAAPDAYVTAHILTIALRVASVEDMIRWTSEPSLLPRINFGKHRGKKFSELPPDYLHWMLKQDMDADVKFTARHHLEAAR